MYSAAENPADLPENECIGQLIGQKAGGTQGKPGTVVSVSVVADSVGEAPVEEGLDELAFRLNSGFYLLHKIAGKCRYREQKCRIYLGEIDGDITQNCHPAAPSIDKVK